MCHSDRNLGKRYKALMISIVLKSVFFTRHSSAPRFNSSRCSFVNVPSKEKEYLNIVFPGCVLSADTFVVTPVNGIFALSAYIRIVILRQDANAASRSSWGLMAEPPPPFSSLVSAEISCFPFEMTTRYRASSFSHMTMRFSQSVSNTSSDYAKLPVQRRAA